jgi:hypothetical protein
MGMAVPVKITKDLTVTSDVRYVYSGPDDRDDSHREESLGVRVEWRF